MTFVTLSDGRSSVPLSQVKLVEEARGELVQLTMADGSVHETYDFHWSSALRGLFQHTFPAQSGTFLICRNGDGDYSPEEFEPVVGWGVHVHGGVFPITHYGTPDENASDVLHPDGRVTNSGGGVYSSFEDYRHSMAEVRAAAIAAE